MPECAQKYRNSRMKHSRTQQKNKISKIQSKSNRKGDVHDAAKKKS